MLLFYFFMWLYFYVRFLFDKINIPLRSGSEYKIVEMYTKSLFALVEKGNAIVHTYIRTCENGFT